MIELEIVSNEATYEVQIAPPLVEFMGGEFRRTCIQDFCVNFDLRMADLLFPRENEKTYQLYFKKVIMVMYFTSEAVV